MPVVRAYLRIGRTKSRNKPFIVRASEKSDQMPLKHLGDELPTVAFALDLEVEDDSFNLAEQVLAQIKVMHQPRLVAGDIVYLNDTP